MDLFLGILGGLLVVYYFTGIWRGASAHDVTQENDPVPMLDGSKGRIGDLIQPGAVLKIEYSDAEGCYTERLIEVTDSDGEAITAFCRLRNNVRSFRVDRIISCVNVETGEIAVAEEAEERRHFMGEKESATDEYVRVNGKSHLTGLVLAVLLGPLGLMYGSALGGFILLLIAIAGAGTVVVPIGIWLLSIIGAPVAVSGYNRKVRAKARLLTAG